MDLLAKTLKDNYDWAVHRMEVLCKMGTVEDVEDADSIRKEFKEWIHVNDKEEQDILSLEYIGKGSEFDI